MIEKLRTMRERNRKTQAEMGKVLNISEGTYRQKERGHVDFTRTEMLKLSLYFKVTLNDLFWNEIEVEKIHV
ncbi:helix-turn-helix transcriptional regulator [Staphylococcus warneri]|uniref:helix-turn-helix transcriptional regulator n=1 Tax=Staphylococcus warneri TaxID=1292 RepID=UPI000D8CFA1E|nr:helix-turn-helix transcriptional regulator [Staphylococcus warneri]MCI2770643.1 helix-turn-helix domain-containing protein [Staphylococcus warneri]MCI2783362.1 helix-turn-helix domain-containing protein [Staphylococcus warneri]PXX85705.1 transcriptional regulator [Staphylococcus warneri]